MKDLMGLMKTARDMQKGMKKAQKELSRLSVTGISLNGNVEITLLCNYKVKEVKINREVELSALELERGIKEALSDGLQKVEKTTNEKMAHLKQGMPSIPGLGL